jgi:protein kinase-like protein
MSIAQGTSLGPYLIQSPLGKGGMGEVYRAQDTRLDRLVAIKVLRDTHGDGAGRERFFREARIVAKLRHPNVITIFDVGEYDDAPYIVMELVEGPTLARLIASPEPLACAQKLRYAMDICDGLTHAHDRGIVHRDVKPSNVLIDGDRARLADFGIAREVSRATITSVSGTVNYVAPEHLTGTPGDHRSDLFSLGAVLYELVTGVKAFPGSMADGVLFRILHEPAPPVPAGVAPDGLDAIVRRALEKDPSRRFQSAAEFREAVARVAAGAYGDTPTTVASAGARPLESSFRRRLLEASTPVEIRRLKYEVEAHLALHQHDVDARMLSDDISRALARAASDEEAVPAPKPARSMGSRRAMMYGASFGVLLIAASTFTLMRLRTGQPPPTVAVNTPRSATSTIAPPAAAATPPAPSAAPAARSPSVAMPLAARSGAGAPGHGGVLPAGSVIHIQLVKAFSMGTAKVSDLVEGRIARDVASGGEVLIPAGTHIVGTVVRVGPGATSDKQGMGIVFHTVTFADRDQVTLQIDPLVYRDVTGGNTRRGAASTVPSGWIIVPGSAEGGRRVGTGTGERGPGGAGTIPAGAMAQVVLRTPVTIAAGRQPRP